MGVRTRERRRLEADPVVDSPTSLPRRMLRQHIRSVRDTYPDLHVTVDQQIAEDDLVVTVVTARGTQKGSFWGIPASNKLITIEGVNIDRIQDGRIVEHKGISP
jgi:predicted ester cyclase